ncbi:hypothetical protein QBC44DRAFT_397906 [Cladorrhinum sp. PSN332]|nr:hypothetical protein QBC44DRAFT_397906 [Cladorrhinum sp. PSN332]
MDPAAILGIVAATVQFVDFGFKVLSGAKEIRSSLSGQTDENEHLELITQEVKRLTENLDFPWVAALKPEDAQSVVRLREQCQRISRRLLALLEKSKVKNKSSKFQSVLASAKSKWYEKDKKELQTQLEECQKQLDRVVNKLSRSCTRDQLEALLSSQNSNTDSLRTIRAELEIIRTQATAVTSFSAESREHVKRLLAMTDEVLTGVAQRKVLSVLGFPEMRTRRDLVEEAHERTFSWIFDTRELRPLGEPWSWRERVAYEEKSKLRNSADGFLRWLAKGDGLFHIAGKLGSGKSTLMKYLCGHEQTREELLKWAEHKKLVFASFYFWKPGSPLQKSLNGLLRSLLHDVLEQCPDIIPKVLPGLWNDIKSPQGGSLVSSDFEVGDIRAAFSRLLDSSEVYKNHKFCFFIDGLDEYEATNSHDHKALVQILSKWTAVAPTSVKLCVSSREDNVFINFFDANKRLRLQDLTAKDMRTFIRDRLSELEEGALDDAVSIITQKADGIFLWVALVVKSIRSRLEDGYQLGEIMEDIDSAPEELEKLFEHLLIRIPKPYKIKAYITFAIVHLLQDPVWTYGGLRFDLSAYSYLDDYLKDPNFAENRIHWPQITLPEQSELEATTHKKLKAQCCGLVELDSVEHVSFTHRSVAEFLAGHITEADQTSLRGHSPEAVLSQLNLALILDNRKRALPDPRKNDPLPRLARDLVVLRKRKKLDTKPPFKYLEVLRSHMESRFVCRELERKALQELDAQSPILSTKSSFWPVADLNPNHARIDITVSKPENWEQVFVRSFSVWHIAASCGAFEYVEHVLHQDSGCWLDSEEKQATVACMAEALHLDYDFDDTDSLDLLRLLLKRGLGPGSVIHTRPGTSILRPVPKGGMTFWNQFVFAFVLATFTGAGSFGKTKLATLVQDFLGYGADPDIKISLVLGAGETDNNRHLGITNVVLVMRFRTHLEGDGGQSYKIVSQVLNWYIIRYIVGIIYNVLKASTVPELESIADKEAFQRFARVLPGASKENIIDILRGREISLKEFICYRDFENKDAIIELIENHNHRNHASISKTTELGGRISSPSTLNENDGSNSPASFAPNREAHKTPLEIPPDTHRRAPMEPVVPKDSEAAAAHLSEPSSEDQRVIRIPGVQSPGLIFTFGTVLILLISWAWQLLT